MKVWTWVGAIFVVVTQQARIELPGLDQESLQAIDRTNLNSLMSMTNENMRCKNSTSKLPKPVKELICLIFDMEGMKRTMLEFGIDLIKMPLEKLSRDQIMEAYKILTEIHSALSHEVAVDQIHMDEMTNRFYSIIPHNFAMQKRPLLNNIEFVKSKLNMLDNLLEIEYTYRMLKDGFRNTNRDKIDYNYSKLKTQIDVLDNSSEEFSIISKYMTNTQNKKHYKARIRHVFKIARQGEEKRYKPFKQMPNRQLLWHGSRSANFAGILSKGLQIAMSSTWGYFGKGIYFADMFDLSVYYTGNVVNTTGLLLLSEVALGEMYQLTSPKTTIKRLPKGKESVKGVGQFHPDPESLLVRSDGLKVPNGPTVPSNFERSDLQYNIYVVYDEAQVNQRYLVQVDFN